MGDIGRRVRSFEEWVFRKRLMIGRLGFALRHVLPNISY